MRVANTTQSEVVWNDLHRLSEDDQHELLARLLERFEPDENSDSEFNAELMHRAEELRVDPSAGIPWEHVLEKRQPLVLFHRLADIEFVQARRRYSRIDAALEYRFVAQSIVRSD